MILNANILRRDTIKLLNRINAQITEVEEEADRMNIPPEKVRDTLGNWALSPLLLAKAQVYFTLVQLQNQK